MASRRFSDSVAEPEPHHFGGGPSRDPISLRQNTDIPHGLILKDFWHRRSVLLNYIPVRVPVQKSPNFFYRFLGWLLHFYAPGKNLSVELKLK
jgi:hypothetical protein